MAMKRAVNQRQEGCRYGAPDHALFFCKPRGTKTLWAGGRPFTTDDIKVPGENLLGIPDATVYAVVHIVKQRSAAILIFGVSALLAAVPVVALVRESRRDPQPFMLLWLPVGTLLLTTVLAWVLRLLLLLVLLLLKPAIIVLAFLGGAVMLYAAVRDNHRALEETGSAVDRAAGNPVFARARVGTTNGPKR